MLRIHSRQRRSALLRACFSSFLICCALCLQISAAGCAVIAPDDLRINPTSSAVPDRGETQQAFTDQKIAVVRVDVRCSDDPSVPSQPLWLAVDTGAYCCVIDKAAARRAGMRCDDVRARLDVGSDSWVVSAQRTRIASLRIAGATFDDFEALVIDLSTIATKTDHPLDGLIGMSLLRRGVWTIDYPSQTVSVASGPSLAESDPDVVPFMYSDGGTPTIVGNIGSHREVFELDTGSDWALELRQDLPGDIDIAWSGNTAATSHDVLSTHQLRFGILKTPVGIGPIRVQNVAIAQSTDSNTIGGGAIDSCRVVFDGPSGLVRFARDKVEAP